MAGISHDASGGQHMDSATLGPVLRRWWPLVLAVTIAAAALGYLGASQRPTTYQSRARLLVGPVNGELEQLRAGDLLARTYAELVTSERVLVPVTRAVGAADPEAAADDLRPRIRATADGPTRTVIIRVSGLDPTVTADLANRVADQLEELSAGGGGAPEGRVTVLDRAVGGAPMSDQTMQLAAFSGLAGGMFVVLALGLFGTAHHRLRDEEEVSAALGAEALGSVAGRRSLRGRNRLEIVWSPESERASDYRLVARKLELVARARGIRSFLVIGVDDPASSTELAANVAYAVSERGVDVALVDADVVSRGVTRLVERSRTRRVHTVTGPAALDAGPWVLLAQNLLLVTPGGADTRTPEDVLDDLAELVGMVLVVAPPQDEAPDALEWARAVDATVVVVDRGRTTSHDVRRAARGLHLVGAEVLGAVIDGSSRDQSWQEPDVPRPPRHTGPSPTEPVGGADASAHRPDPSFTART